MIELPKAFRNILNISAAEISVRKQNLMALLYSIKSDIVKIKKCTLDRLVLYILLLIMTLTWNLAQMLLTVLPTHEKNN